jgi:glycosyltransferase involved in cell wall biosynthesis
MDDGRPLINFVVCGDFKQLQLIPYLNKIAKIGRVYFASKISNNGRKLGLSKDQAQNLFLKEYLLQFHARYLRHAMATIFYPMYDRIWQKAVLRAWKPCDVLLAVLQGKDLKVLQRAKDEGATILGHPVVCHPSFRHKELRAECDRLGLAPDPFMGSETIVSQELMLCDRLYCLSGLVRDSFVAAGFSADRIDIVRLPTDMETFTPTKLPRSVSEPFRVLCVAEITPIKGHIYLLEAWRKLALKNAELVFAGTLRWEMAPIMERYKGSFRYAGALDKYSLARLYQSSSVLVLASVEDGFGLVISEALACGIPVITTEHVGARDIIEPGHNGFVVPPRDVEALADAINRIYSSPALQEQLRKGAIASRSTFPSAAETAGKLAAICNEMAFLTPIKNPADDL